MKKLFVLLAISFGFSNMASATHLMGGDVKIIYDTALQQYKMILTHYRDNSGPTAPASPQIQLFMVETDLPTGLQQISQSSAISLFPDAALGWQVPMVNIPYNVEKYTYSGIIPFPISTLQPGRYKFITSDCCRNGAILNLANPLSESISLSVDVYINSGSIIIDNSPEFLAEPIIYGPVNQLWNYNPFPFDADGDSLSWSVVTPLSSATFPAPISLCTAYTAPPANAANPFTLNNFTGELAWEPSQVGNYVASFSIDAYRNGTLISTVNRDMQYIVLSDSLYDSTGNYYYYNKLPSFSNGSTYQYDAVNKINYMYYTPGQQFQFEIFGEDLNTNQILSMNGISNLFKLDLNPATFTMANTGLGNQVKGVFKWTPPSTYEREEKVVFRVNDGYYNKDFTLVLRKSNFPASTTALDRENEIHIIPNPITNNEVKITFQDAITMQNAKVNITDCTGKIIGTNLVSKTGKTLHLKLPTMASGIYFAQITTATGVVSKKIYIQE